MNNYWSARIDFSLGSRMIDDDINPEHFMIEFSGDIRVTTDTDDNAYVGSVEGARFEIDAAVEAGFSAHDIFDVSEDFYHYFAQIYEPDGSVIEDIEQEFDRFDYSDLLVIQSLKINPIYQGKSLGLLALRGTIMEVARGCSLVLLRALPQQFELKPDHDAEAWNTLQLDRFEKDEDLAVSSLKRYYAKLGFRELGDDYMALSTAYGIPEPSKFC